MAPQPPRRTTIAPINNAKNRRVTFAKRRNGIFKKAYELSVLCSCEIVVVIRDVRGRIHQFSAVFPDDSQAGPTLSSGSVASEGSGDDDQVSTLLPREPTSIVPRAHTDDSSRFLAKFIAGDAGPVAEARGPSFYDKGKPPMFVIGGDSNAGDEDEEDEEAGDVESRDWRANSVPEPTQMPSFGAIMSTYTPAPAAQPATLPSPPSNVPSRALGRAKSTSAARSTGRKRAIPASASVSPPFSATRGATLTHPAFQAPPAPPFVSAHHTDMRVMGNQTTLGEHHPFLPFCHDSASASNGPSSTSSVSSFPMASRGAVPPGYPPSASTASYAASTTPFTLYPSPNISPVSVMAGSSGNEAFATQLSHHPVSNPEPWNQPISSWQLTMPAQLENASHSSGPPFGTTATHFPLEPSAAAFHPENALTGYVGREIYESGELEPVTSQSSVEPSVVSEPFLSFLEQHFYPDKSPDS